MGLFIWLMVFSSESFCSGTCSIKMFVCLVATLWLEISILIILSMLLFLAYLSSFCYFLQFV